MYRSYGKTKGILLPRNYFKFPLVKVIVSKCAYKSFITTKNVRFLRTDHRNVVHENIFRYLGDVICIKTCSNQSGLSIAPTRERFDSYRQRYWSKCSRKHEVIFNAKIQQLPIIFLQAKTMSLLHETNFSLVKLH